jgi:hypothetical protein
LNDEEAEVQNQSVDRRSSSHIKAGLATRLTHQGVGAKLYKNMYKPAIKRLNMVRHYVTTYYKAYKNPMLFHDIKTYCMFVGYARSGHSIIGALLDAHPNVILPDEADVLRYLSAGFSREQIYHILLAKSQRQAMKGRTKQGREGQSYSYLIPGQWQGRFEQLQVIGDSTAGISTQRLAESPELLPRLQHIMKDVHVKLIHVVRNPYDNISTMCIRGGRSFESTIERYFTNCETIVDLRKQINDSDILVVRHEEFLSHPEGCLGEVCRFLGIEPTYDYLRACASILYTSPAKSRHKVQWNSETIDMVEHRIHQFDFLRGYSYDS